MVNINFAHVPESGSCPNCKVGRMYYHNKYGYLCDSYTVLFDWDWNKLLDANECYDTRNYKKN